MEEAVLPLGDRNRRWAAAAVTTEPGRNRGGKSRPSLPLTQDHRGFSPPPSFPQLPPRLAPTSHTHPRGPPRCQGVIWVRWWEPTKRLLTTQLLLKVIQERAKVYSAGTLVHSAVLHIWKLLDLQSSHQKEKNCNCVWWRMLPRFIVAIIL